MLARLFVFIAAAAALASAQTSLLAYTIRISNCAKSSVDSLSIERCNICYDGYTRSFDQTECLPSTIAHCDQASSWGCLSCSCGYVVNYTMTACVLSTIEGCQRLTSSGTGCIQAKHGYTIKYTTVSTYTYVSMTVDTSGSLCGWRISGATACSICHPGFYMEANVLSCKRLSTRLQNQHAFALTTSAFAVSPTTTIVFIPGWTTWTGKTISGGFESPIANCETYQLLDPFDTLPNCLTCLQSYVPTFNQRVCDLGHSSCAYLDNTTRLCAQCVDTVQYYINAAKNYCVIHAQMFDNCVTRNQNADTCTLCNAAIGAIINAANHCDLIVGCMLSNGVNACLTCDTLRFLDNTVTPNLCRALPPNCATATPPSTCNTCETGYYLWSSVCYLKMPNCSTVNSSSGVQANHFCSACAAGYHFVGTLCVPDISNCITHAASGSDTCLLCSTMYTPSTDGTECLLHNDQFQTDCERTDGVGNCQQCASLKYSADCDNVTNHELCLISAGLTDVCLKCLPNAILVASACVAVNSTCLRTDGLAECKQCMKGYYIDATTKMCVAIAYCAVSNGLVNTCLACKTGYFLTSSGCMYKPYGCAVAAYNAGTLSCLQCLNTYGMSAGACSIILNCAVTTGLDMTCYQCSDYFQLSSDTLSCAAYNPDPTLAPPTYCAVFNTMTVASILVYSGNLVAVTPSYGFMRKCTSPRVPRIISNTQVLWSITSLVQTCVYTSTLEVIIDGCLIYGYTAGTCLYCQTNYHLASSICYPNVSTPYCVQSAGLAADGVCDVCVEGMLLKSSACISPVDNCATYNTTRCTACQSGFYLSADYSKCTVYAGQQCLTWLADYSACTSCQVGFETISTADSNVCLYNPNNINCATIVSNACATCASSDVMVKDSSNNPYCLTLGSHPDLQCRKYNSSGACTGCAANYILQFTTSNSIYMKCVVKHGNCSANDGTKCTACTGGLYLDTSHNTNGCVAVVNCISTAPGLGDGCSQCNTATGYYLQSAFVCAAVPNCVVSRNGVTPTCFQCLSLYYPSDVDGSCVTLTNYGCLVSAGQDDLCSQCNDYYYLSQTTFLCVKGSVVGCIKYSPLNNPTSATVCVLCSPGYVLTAIGGCTKIPNCSVSDGTITAVCTSCDDMFYLNTTTNTCMTPHPFINYCRRFANNNLSSCTQCENTYYFNGSSVCTQRTTRNDYCAVYSLTSDECTLCQTVGGGGVIVYDTLSPKKGFCNQVVINHCTLYQQNLNKCKICSQTTDYLTGWLVPTSNFCQDVSLLLCLTLNTYGTTCTNCQERVNQSLTANSVCRAICASTSNYLVPDVIPTNPYVCTARTASTLTNCEYPNPYANSCQVCAVGYVWNSTTSLCEVMTTLMCAKNDSSRSQTCIQCAPHHRLEATGKCTSLRRTPNCLSYVNNSSKCYICQTGYYLDDTGRNCIAATTITNCNVYAFNYDKCLLCSTGYTISANGLACFFGRSTTFCVVSSTTVSSSECAVCQDGYIIQTGSATCLLNNYNIPGCISIGTVSGITFLTCTACDSGYTLYNHVCVHKETLKTCEVVGCLAYTQLLYDSSVCSACTVISGEVSIIPGQFQLVNNQCIFMKTNAIGASIIQVSLSLLLLLLLLAH